MFSKFFKDATFMSNYASSTMVPGTGHGGLRNIIISRTTEAKKHGRHLGNQGSKNRQKSKSPLSQGTHSGPGNIFRAREHI